ncbi:MAG: Gfo/Idh/MocA family oxidoreductase [Burkholderiales bacterium]|nr:Gfo/Idh/MocA family oxidoreductase [Opitutaceae bacterium]
MSLSTVIVGCGNIAKSYAKDLKTYPEITLAGFSDLDPTRAATFAAEFGARAYASLDEVLADPSVQLIVNLTIHHAHEEVITKCLAAGKHVHTEKPLALSSAAARRLAADADARGLRLSSAPITWMGNPQQSAAAILRSGELGRVRQIYAEINHGRIEAWHPNPAPFYDVGIVWDVCIYPLTLLTAFLGPVRSVQAFQRLLSAERTTQDGKPFTITKPEFVVAVLDFADGTVARLSGNFYNNASKQGASIEFHGDTGSLVLGSSFMFNASVERCDYGKPLAAVPPAKPVFDGIEFGLGVRELAQAIAENRPHRASAAQAAHVIEIMESIDRSAAANGAPQSVVSDFPIPAPL